MAAETDPASLTKLGKEYNKLSRAVSLVDEHTKLVKSIVELEILESDERKRLN